MPTVKTPRLSAGLLQMTRVGAVLAEHVQYLVYAATLLAAGVELAVAVGTGSTLAEAIVTLAIHLLGLRDVGKVFLAFTHVLSTFQDDRAIAAGKVALAKYYH